MGRHMIGDERTITIRCIGTNSEGREIWSIRIADLPDCQLHFDVGPDDRLIFNGGTVTPENT